MSKEDGVKTVLDSEAWHLILAIHAGLPSEVEVGLCGGFEPFVAWLGSCRAMDALLALRAAIARYEVDLVFSALLTVTGRPVAHDRSPPAHEFDDDEWKRLFALP